MYSQFEQDRDRGNFDSLPELHAVLSGMKVSVTSGLLHGFHVTLLRPPLLSGNTCIDKNKLRGCGACALCAGCQHEHCQRWHGSCQEGLRRPWVQPAVGAAHHIHSLCAERDLGRRQQCHAPAGKAFHPHMASSVYTLQRSLLADMYMSFALH